MSSSPHDALFKAVLGQPEHARGALRAVMPAAVGDALDWPSLALREVIGAPHGLEVLVQVMRYILLVNDHVEPKALQAVLERVATLDAKDILMTAGERLIQQGEEQGVQKGVQQGVQQGVRALLLRLLRKRFGDDVDAAAEQRITAASTDQLEIWGDRVLSATTLAELFSD